MTDRVDQYVLVMGESAAELSERVNVYVKEGYRPHGSACVAIGGVSLLVTRYTQAMVKFTSRHPVNYGRTTLKEK